MEPYERVKIVLEREKVSQRKFAKKTGLSESATSALLNGNSSVSKVLANCIEYKYGYRSEWILTGTGEKRTNKGTNQMTERQRRIFEIFDKLPVDLQNMFIELWVKINDRIL